MRIFGVLIGAAVLLCACSPLTTKYPIGSTTGLVADQNLIGTWVARDPKTGDVQRTRDGKTAVFVHVLPGKNNMLEIVWLGFPTEPEKSGEVLFAYATSGRAGDYRFLNITWPAAERTVSGAGTIPYRYAYAPNGDLLVFAIDQDKAIAAIQSGAIAGTIEEKGYIFDGKEYGQHKLVRLTADPVALDAFFATAQGADLFEPLGPLKKMD
jgi:hypothetical protein